MRALNWMRNHVEWTVGLVGGISFFGCVLAAEIAWSLGSEKWYHGFLTLGLNTLFPSILLGGLLVAWGPEKAISEIKGFLKGGPMR